MLETIGNKMPILNPNAEGLSKLAKLMIQKITGRESRLRTSKPKMEYEEYIDKWGRKCRKPTLDTGCAAYVWRMVAFQVSHHSQHQCMPVCAIFDIPGSVQESREISKKLDVIVDEIINTIPKSEWYGVARWGRALGMI